jgi:flagellar assembly factor FliW
LQAPIAWFRVLPALDETKKERSETMAIQSNRFGSVEVDAKDVINFPKGIIGFTDERQFVLIRTTNAHSVGWLQSTTNPGMALPVVSAHVLAPPYPDVDIESYAEAVGLGTDLEELAVLVVLNAQPGVPATVNLVAPIIVNAATRVGAQVLLDGTRFTTREIFVLPSRPDAAVRETGQSTIGAPG